MTASRAKTERFIQDLRQDLRPQREWGEGRGIFLVVGHFVVGVAAGTWLFGLVFDLREALVLAFALAAAGGVSHLGFLGRPERFWRMAQQVRTSWISRGFVGLALFLAGAPFYLAALYLPDALWPADALAARAGYGLALAGMAILIGYMGFVYSASKGIPFWASPLHPVLYVAYALRGGIAGVFVTLAVVGRAPAEPNLLLGIWIGVTAAVAAFFLVELHAALTGGSPAARKAVLELLSGRLAAAFYGGTLAVGLVVPTAFAYGGFSDHLSLGAMAAIGLASAAGDFFIKYATIRAGVHLPVWRPFAPQR